MCRGIPPAVPGSHIAGASQISCTSSGHGGGCRLSSAYGKPAVCVSRWRMVARSLPFVNAGRYSTTLSSSPSRPCSHSCAIAIAVTTLPLENHIVIVDGSIATPGRASPPAASSIVIPSTDT